jgi:hypothetical protein
MPPPGVAYHNEMYPYNDYSAGGHAQGGYYDPGPGPGPYEGRSQEYYPPSLNGSGPSSHMRPSPFVAASNRHQVAASGWLPSPTSAQASLSAGGGGVGRPSPSSGWPPVKIEETGSAGRPSPGWPQVKLEDLVAQGRPKSGNAEPGFTIMPLHAPQPAEHTRQSSGGPQAQADASAQSGPSDFIKKLFRMLEEETAMYGQGKPPGEPRAQGARRGSVGWGRNGTSFVVWDMNEFTTQVL